MITERGKINGFLSGLLLGGVIGGVLAMLYTPVSGKKMRRKISRTADNIIEDVNDFVETGKHKFDGLVRDSKKRATNILDDARKIVSN